MKSSGNAIYWQLYPLDSYPGSLWQDWQRLNLKFHNGNKMLSAEFTELVVKYFGDTLYIAAGYPEPNTRHPEPNTRHSESKNCHSELDSESLNPVVKGVEPDSESCGSIVHPEPNTRHPEPNTRHPEPNNRHSELDSESCGSNSHHPEPIALAVLEKAGKGRWQVFKPSQAQVGLIVMDPSKDPSLKMLVKQLPGLVTRVDFYGLDPLEHQGLIDSLAEEAQCYATNIQIKLHNGVDEYWKQRPRKLRQNINRYQNRLTREFGDYQILASTRYDDVLRTTDRYGMLEAKGWKGRLGTALHPSNEQGQFYKQVLCKAAENEQALVLEMYLQDRLVASRLCIMSDTTLIALKTTFDEEYKKHAVGRLLLKDLISYLYESTAVRCIDFYTNATSDQMDWCTDSRPMYNASYYPVNVAGQLLKSAVRLKKCING